MTRIAVVQFPGSNCETETVDALRAAGAESEIVRWNVPVDTWHRFAGFVLPGGFSYEDRVRGGAIAAKHRVLDAVAAAADAGRPVLGICNGFQTLVNLGLLPGFDREYTRRSVALTYNDCGNFRDDWVTLKIKDRPAYLPAASI